MGYRRYAIYYVPAPDQPWVQFATSWLGWDMQTGQMVRHPVLTGLPGPVAETTRTPQKYGLHGTLKPPFRLKAGTSRDDLETAIGDLCLTLTPLRLSAMRLTRLGRFLALCPESCAALSDLAAACVRDLDHFRAPLTQDDLDRRRTGHLTQRQESNLRSWGYPHVLDDFRFHITLTGRLSKPDLDAVHQILQQALMPLLPQDMGLTDLALTGEDKQGRFHLIRRFRLSGL